MVLVVVAVHLLLVETELLLLVEMEVTEQRLLLLAHL
jgi:hypothetical protein